jgi:TfoX/Sxy family transcriptional regulator of competence genes
MSTVGRTRRDTAPVAYDEDLAERIRERVAAEDGLTEKRMFGGLAFLINGNMAVSASGQGGMLLRVDPARTEELVRAPHARRFEMRGREMDGWLRIDPDALGTEADLTHWVTLGVTYARSLPPK